MLRLMKKENKSKTGKFACLSILLCLAVIMGYLEALIPVSFLIPGIKLGLANYVTVIVLYLFHGKEACIISVLRVLIVGFLFMNFTMILYSLAGSLCSAAIMIMLKRNGKLSAAGVSAAGGIAHNLAQLAVAYFMFPVKILFGYIPWLLLAGTAAGTVIGVLVNISFPRIRRGYYKVFGEI